MTKLLLALLLMAMTSQLLATDNTDNFEQNRLFIKLNPGNSMPVSNLITSSKHLFGNNYLVTTTDALKLEKALSKHPAIKRTERSYIAAKKILPEAVPVDLSKDFDLDFSGLTVFNDPDVARVWSFKDSEQNGVSVIKSYSSPLGRDHSEIIVAVVDTGVDYNHEDLKDIMWVNSNEIPGNGIDDDGNGYVDDIHGINTLVRNSDGAATGNPMASHSHGTHVSGTIAAVQNNGTGIAGIASNVKIMAIRTVPDSSDETDANVVESYLYAAKHGAKLINCSFGKDRNEGGNIVNETIDHIGQTYGTLVLAAAGNDWGRNIDESRVYPASYDSDYLMVVASTSSSGGLSWFSNIGLKSVDVAAPGSDIYSTIPRNRYGNMSGTSMATPTTVGVAAEVLSQFPELGPKELKTILIESVTKVGNFSSKMVSGGRIDLFNALRAAEALQSTRLQ